MKDFRAYILGLCGKKEGYVVEFKGAKGGFPGSFWESYSAFANTAGGIIVLGIIQKDGIPANLNMFGDNGAYKKFQQADKFYKKYGG